MGLGSFFLVLYLSACCYVGTDAWYNIGFEQLDPVDVVKLDVQGTAEHCLRKDYNYLPLPPQVEVKVTTAYKELTNKNDYGRHVVNYEERYTKGDKTVLSRICSCSELFGFGRETINRCFNFYT